MSIKDLIPDKVYLYPLSMFLPAGVAGRDEDGSLVDKKDVGHAWLVSERPASSDTPRYINIDKIVGKLLDRAQRESEKLEEQYEKENGYYDDGGTKIASGFRGGVAWAIKMMKGEVSDG